MAGVYTASRARSLRRQMCVSDRSREAAYSMNVAMTGATGFTGRRVAAKLLRRGHRVSALVRPASVRRELPAGVTRVEGDMADAGALGELLRGADAFVHVASIGFGHADGLVTALKTADIQRSVFFSSTALFTRCPRQQGRRPRGRGSHPNAPGSLDDPAADDDLRR
jgi:nucleoside-diphosphate-sugar epimerase